MINLILSQNIRNSSQFLDLVIGAFYWLVSSKIFHLLAFVYSSKTQVFIEENEMKNENSYVDNWKQYRCDDKARLRHCTEGL